MGEWIVFTSRLGKRLTGKIVAFSPAYSDDTEDYFILKLDKVSRKLNGYMYGYCAVSNKTIEEIE